MGLVKQSTSNRRRKRASKLDCEKTENRIEQFIRARCLPVDREKKMSHTKDCREVRVGLKYTREELGKQGGVELGTIPRPREPEIIIIRGTHVKSA